MPVFAAPGFLLAGALAALVPLALHLIRRRPPVRAALPTARFLVADARMSVRVSRPTDVPLLLLRMLLLVLLGIGLAGPAWVPAPRGTVDVVVVDRGVSAEGWRAALGEARGSLLGEGGTGRGALVLFDTAADVVGDARLTSALFDSLLAAGPSSSDVDLAAGLRAIPSAVRGLRGADSVRVRLVSSFGGGWSPGTGAVREAAWPGSLALSKVAGRDRLASTDTVAGRRAAVVARQGGDFAAAALAAMGYEVSRGADGDGEVYVVLDPVSDDLARWTDIARAGATVVVGSTGAEGDTGGEMWFAPELQLSGAGARTPLQPSPDRAVIAAWDDGTAAATAQQVGEGCVVEAGTDLEGGEFPFQASYPAWIGRLARGCEAPSTVGALDAGALALLRGSGPAAVPAGSFDTGRTGTALGRWFLAAALAAALLDTFLAYRRRG